MFLDACHVQESSVKSLTLSNKFTALLHFVYIFDIWKTAFLIRIFELKHFARGVFFTIILRCFHNLVEIYDILYYMVNNELCVWKTDYGLHFDKYLCVNIYESLLMMSSSNGITHKLFIIFTLYNSKTSIGIVAQTEISFIKYIVCSQSKHNNTSGHVYTCPYVLY